MDGGPVLLVTPRWTRDGGVATHAMASAAALARAGSDVHVVAARVHSQEPPAGVTVHHSPSLFDQSAPAAQRLGDALGCEPGVVHVHQVDHPELVAFLRERAPVLVSAHGYPACTSGVHYFRPGQECGRAHGYGCIPNLLLRGCAHTRDARSLPGSFRRAGAALDALLQADLVVSYSSAVDRHLAANGIARREVVPLFTTMEPARGSGHAGRRRVVCAGRVVAPKGVDVLIRAARSVDAEFVICGDGRRLEAMRRLARRLRVDERVRFSGWLSAEDLAQELADASVVAIPSLWPEPFGLVGIEALAAGRPVVASLTGGVGDWLQDGANGIAVPPGDERALARALEELLADPSRQSAMGEAGRVLVAERFSPERHVATLEKAYARAGSHWREQRHASGAEHAARDEPSPV